MKRIEAKGAAAPALFLLASGACTPTLDIGVDLVNPCNQEALASVDIVRFEARGEGIGAEEIVTYEEVGSAATAPIEVPLAPDFQLVATGHRPNFDAPASALGLSAPVDLGAVDGDGVEISLPFSLLGRFYRTTDLESGDGKTCTRMAQDRFGASATVLRNGQVLILGGARYSDGFLEFPRSIEIFDPATGQFLDGPPGTNRKWELGKELVRRNHTASLLPDGRVLVAGGQRPSASAAGKEEALQAAFIIDPRDLSDLKVASYGVPMFTARTGHRAVTLGDGRIVLVGGRQLNPADDRLESQVYLDSLEYYDPADGGFAVASDMSGNQVKMSSARFGHSALAIAGTGDIFIAGGMDRNGPVTSVEVFRFVGHVAQRIPAGVGLGTGAIHGSATLTQDGAVLISGGYATMDDVRGLAPTNSVDGVEMWAVDQASGAPQRLCTATLVGGRGHHSSAVVGLRGMFVGGRDPTGQPRADAEVVDLRPVSEAMASGNCFTQAPTTTEMEDPRAEHSSVVLPSTRELLVLGGISQDPGGAGSGVSTDGSEIFSDIARRLMLSPTPTP